MIVGFTKSSKLIDTTLDKQHVLSDYLGTLGGLLKLILDLLNMPMRWTSICVHNGKPGVTGGGGLLNQGNQRSRDRAHKSTKEQFVLLNPREKVWILCVLVGVVGRGRWARVRAIDKFMEIVTNEDSFNLKLLG